MLYEVITRIKRNISFKLSKTNAQKLAKESNKNEMNPDELASKIISDVITSYSIHYTKLYDGQQQGQLQLEQSHNEFS